MLVAHEQPSSLFKPFSSRVRRMLAQESVPFLAALRRNLNQGARSLMLLHPVAQTYVATTGQLVALVSLELLLTLASQIVLYGTDGEINTWALRGALFDIPFVLLAGWWVARVSLKGLKPLSFAVALMSMSVVFACLGLVAVASLRQPGTWLWIAYWVMIVLWWLCACTLLARLTGRSARSNWPGFSLVSLIAVSSQILPTAPLWQARDDASNPPQRASIEREAAFHAQAGLLEGALHKLLPQRAGVTDLYFAGFASYAAEDVFRKEIDAIAPLMRERFDAAGRSVLLVNNASTVMTLPLATKTNLARTLRGIGSRIDREEDIVVLYLTTHGSERHELAVKFWPLKLDDITPAALKIMLDEAGIKWRVVIVSACYSGGYIEPLKDDNTLVMTASEATRTSFGCGSESDFTYFGRALFDEELRRTHSFAEAFGRARISIAEREKQMGHEYSNPQIAIGAAIAEKLQRLEARLAGAAIR